METSYAVTLLQTLQIESTIEPQQHNAPRNTLPLSLVWISECLLGVKEQQSHWHNAIPKHITVGIHIWWAVRVSTLQSEAKSFFQFWSNLLTFEKKYKLLGSYLHDISLQREVILHLVLCEPEPKSTDISLWQFAILWFWHHYNIMMLVCTQGKCWIPNQFQMNKLFKLLLAFHLYPPNEPP